VIIGATESIQLGVDAPNTAANSTADSNLRTEKL